MACGFALQPRVEQRGIELRAHGARHGLLVNAVRPDAIRLAPPLVLTEDDVDDAVPRLAAALDDVRRSVTIEGL